MVRSGQVPAEGLVAIGIDLAAGSRSTAVCVLHGSAWDVRGSWRVAYLGIGARGTAREGVPRWDNRELTGLVREALLAGPAARVGIDSPWGWPAPFLALMGELAAPGAVGPGGELARAHDEWDARSRWRLRATDLVAAAHPGIRPMSVSTDSLGVVALRCAAILAAAGAAQVPGFRLGAAGIYEVYPAGSLASWGMRPAGSYKRDPTVRAALAQELVEAFALDEVTSEQREALAASDHALDALLAALTVAVGQLPAPEDAPAHALQRARVAGHDVPADVLEAEGWLWLPQ